MQDPGPQTSKSWWVGALIAVVMFAGLSWVILSWNGARAITGPLPEVDMVAELGKALVDPNQFVIPFEVASVLLLAAMIGAIMVAWDRN